MLNFLKFLFIFFNSSLHFTFSYRASIGRYCFYYPELLWEEKDGQDLSDIARASHQWLCLLPRRSQEAGGCVNCPRSQLLSFLEAI